MQLDYDTIVHRREEEGEEDLDKKDSGVFEESFLKRPIDWYDEYD